MPVQKLFRIDWSVSGSYYVAADSTEEAKEVSETVDIDPFEGDGIDKEHPVEWPPAGTCRKVLSDMEKAVATPPKERVGTARYLGRIAFEACFTSDENTPEVLVVLRQAADDEVAAEREERIRRNGQLALPFPEPGQAG